MGHREGQRNWPWDRDSPATGSKCVAVPTLQAQGTGNPLNLKQARGLLVCSLQAGRNSVTLVKMPDVIGYRVVPDTDPMRSFVKECAGKANPARQ